MFIDNKNRIFFIKIIISLIFINSLTVLNIIFFKKYYIYIAIINFLISILIAIVVYKYLNANYNILKKSTEDIQNFMIKDKTLSLPSNKEGQLYKLFHEINLLASILSAHARKELETKEALRDTILDISHQIKTPLSALNIYNGIIQEEVKNMEKVSEFIDLSEEELDRIELLVKNLLTMVKFDTDTIILNKKQENLNQILHEIRKSFNFRLKNEEKTLTILGDDDISLYCDKNWFKESISNLIKNALDYTDTGDKVIVEYQELGSIIQINIIDNGKGIEKDEIDYIFKRFFRSKTSYGNSGTGLGLALTKSIINKHGGTIQVKSEINKGSKFTINLVIPTKM